MIMIYDNFIDKYKPQIDKIVDHLGPAGNGTFMERRLEIISLINGVYIPNDDVDKGKINISKHDVTAFLIKWS